MSCPYCTPMVDEDTGESLEFCRKPYHHIDSPIGRENVTTRINLIQDKDDGQWFLQILLYSEWLSEFIHSLGEPSERAGLIVTSIPAPPYCPFCGRKLT